jgi:hypothetical protein
MTEHSEHPSGEFEDQPVRGEVRYSQVSARVPEEVGQGCFSNGVLVLSGPFEYVLDFVMRLSEAPRVVSRVVLPRPVVQQFVHALTQNIAMFESRFGPLPKPPRLLSPGRSGDPAGGDVPSEVTTVAPTHGREHTQAGIVGAGLGGETVLGTAAPPPSIDQIYDDLRLPDALLSGRYANAVLIRHSATEFCLDFITNIYPRSAVSARVYLAAANVGGLLSSLRRSLDDPQSPPPREPA